MSRLFMYSTIPWGTTHFTKKTYINGLKPYVYSISNCQALQLFFGKTEFVIYTAMVYDVVSSIDENREVNSK